jgi:hypothetical protein
MKRRLLDASGNDGTIGRDATLRAFWPAFTPPPGVNAAVRARERRAGFFAHLAETGIA